jgi:hypothetical protein
MYRQLPGLIIQIQEVQHLRAMIQKIQTITHAKVPVQKTRFGIMTAAEITAEEDNVEIVL